MSQSPESHLPSTPGSPESSDTPPVTASNAVPAPAPTHQASQARSPVPLPEPRTRSDSSLGLWLAGAAIVLPCLAALFVVGMNKFKHADSDSVEVVGQAAPSKPDTVDSVAIAGAAQRLASLPAEEKPPVGNWQILSTAQMRYCATQKLRLKTVVTLVRTEKPTEADIYNSRLADYKARCQNMGNTPEEYQAILDAVQTDHAAIEKSARAEWTSTLVNGPVSAPEAAVSPAAPAPATASSSSSTNATQPNTVMAPKVPEAARPAAFPFDTSRSDAATMPTVPTAPATSSAGESAARSGNSGPGASVPSSPAVKANPSTQARPEPSPPPSAAPDAVPAVKPQRPAPTKELEWCVEGRCARL